MTANWPIRRLGDLFEIARGGSPRPIEKFLTNDPAGLNWVKISDATASGKLIERTKEKIRPEGLGKTRFVRPGDFLLTNSMSFGRPYIMATEGCIHDGWLVLKPNDPDAIDQNYFYHLLGSDELYQRFAARAGGSTVRNLNTNIVSKVEIKVPPIEIQRRAAHILDRADAIQRYRKQAFKLLGTLTQSIFLEMFGSPIINQRKLPIKRLSSISNISSGGTPSKEVKAFWDGEIPWVSPKDMKTNEIYDAEDHISDDALAKTSLKLVEPETVLMVVRGMILTHTVPISITRRAVTINQDIKAIRFDAEVHPTFAFWCLRAQASYILSKVSTAAHGTKRLETSNIEELNILLPTLSKQQEFVRAAEVVGKTYGSLLTTMQRDDALFASLQRRVFSGEL